MSANQEFPTEHVGGSTSSTSRAYGGADNQRASSRVPRTSYHRGSRVDNRASTLQQAIANQAANATGGTAAPANMFADADAMREKLHENIAQKDYDVCDYYYETGVFQALARNGKFGATTLAVISLNAVWMGLDVECNDPDADGDIYGCPVQGHDKDFWLAGEQIFCAFFSFELLVRFFAFKKKWSAMKDNWFKFDAVLVFFMVVETWALPIVTGGDSNALSDFALLRMLRLLRLTRMVRLMRSVPELMTLLKGMAVACKSVSYTLLLLLMFMYIFSIIFKSQLVETEDEELAYHFSGIPRSMWTLLLAGCLLDDISSIANLLMQEGFFMAFVFIVFVLVSALMVLNMLIGVLCAVVSAVAAAEKEKALITYVKSKLITVLEQLDEDGNGTITKKEFQQLVNITPAVAALDELGVDVPNLISLSDHLFEGEDDDTKNDRERAKSVLYSPDTSQDITVVRKSIGAQDELEEGEEEEATMTFAEFLEMVIRLRSDNVPSVADVVELRKLIFRSQRQVGRRLNHIEKGQHELQRGIRMICEQLDSALTLSLSVAQGEVPTAQNPQSPEESSGSIGMSGDARIMHQRYEL